MVRAGVAVGFARGGDGFHRLAHRAIAGGVEFDLDTLSVERSHSREKLVLGDQLEAAPIAWALIIMRAAAVFIRCQHDGGAPLERHAVEEHLHAVKFEPPNAPSLTLRDERLTVARIRAPDDAPARILFEAARTRVAGQALDHLAAHRSVGEPDDAVGEHLIGRDLDCGLLHFGAGLGNKPFDIARNHLAQHAGGLALGIAVDHPAVRGLGGAGNPGNLEHARIDPHAVQAFIVEHDRIGGGCRIEQAAVLLARLERRAHPAAAKDPFARLGIGRAGFHRRRNRRRARALGKAARELVATGEVGVDVHIVEAGHHSPSRQIDFLRAGGGHGLDLGVRADCDNRACYHRECLRASGRSQNRTVNED